jgi:hypothetical protein
MNGKLIRDITEQGLVYTDESGNEVFIDFSACYANYVKRNTRPEHLKQMREGNHWNDADEKRYIEQLSEWREVAARGEDGFPWSKYPANGPCIEFYAEPPIRFVFETEDEFQRIWRTNWFSREFRGRV